MNYLFCKILRILVIFQRVIFLMFSFYVRYSTLLHLPPLRFHFVGGCWDRSKDSCDYGIGCQINHSARSHPLSARSHPRIVGHFTLGLDRFSKKLNETNMNTKHGLQDPGIHWTVFLYMASTELLFWCAEPRVPSPGWEEDQRGGIPGLQGTEYTIKGD